MTNYSWKVVDYAYLDYLRKFEPRIPFSDYGTDKHKPFFGVLFETEDLLYITQISHPEKRHKKLRTNTDFKKIYHPVHNHLIAVVNLNYMFPIPKNKIFDLEYKNIDKYRTFETLDEKSQYIDLLKRELVEINKLDLSTDALKIYSNKYDFPTNDLAKRSLDYKALEKLAKEYTD